MVDLVKRWINTNKFCYYVISYSFILYQKFVWLLSVLFCVFPVKKNKIVCCSTKGKRYGDNAKYISDELIRRNRGYEIVWLLNDNYEGELPAEVRRVSTKMIPMLYELMTARIWIDTNTKSGGIRKRKGQIYIQTWHGSYGLKKMYKDYSYKPSITDIYNLDRDVKKQDLFISNSDFYTKIYRSGMGYQGEVLKCGSPRNDIFFRDKEKYVQKIRKEFKCTGKKILLYAPTYRDDFSVKCFDVDFPRVVQCLENKFDGEWVILVRLHPQNMRDAKDYIQYSEKVLNATEYNNMQELLVASDILITDYSSCMFDFVTTGKACFLYATDVEQYQGERDFYMDIYSLPFPLAENNAELIDNITNFDEVIYREKIRELHEKVGLCDFGNASVAVADWIDKKMEK